MARSTAFIRLPGKQHVLSVRTNLKGCGAIHEGEEFTVRELWPNENRLIKGGRHLRVRVKAIDRVNRRYRILDVEVLADMTPSLEQGELFTS